MLYQAPFDTRGGNPNAPYINGNPGLSIPGSIPPGEAIEHPQREITNFITDSNKTPDAADLHQLSKSVQSGFVVHCIDQGSANHLMLTGTPTLTAAPTRGMHLFVEVNATNTGTTDVTIDGYGPTPLKDVLRNNLGANMINALGVSLIYFDGVEWQLVVSFSSLAGATGPAGQTGATGAPGMVGQQGPPGAQGMQGVQGQQGVQGAQGATGPAGTFPLTGGVIGSYQLSGANDPYWQQGMGGVWENRGYIGPITQAGGPYGSYGQGQSSFVSLWQRIA